MLLGRVFLLSAICLMAIAPFTDAKRRGKNKELVSGNVTCDFKRENFQVYMNTSSTYTLQTVQDKMFGKKKTCRVTYKRSSDCQAVTVEIIEANLPTNKTCITFTEHDRQITGLDKMTSTDVCKDEMSPPPAPMEFDTNFQIRLQSGRKGGAETNVTLQLTCKTGPELVENCRCGIAPPLSTRIVGGDETQNLYPWVAKVEVADAKPMVGTLISAKWMLMPAAIANVTDPSKLKVTLPLSAGPSEMDLSKMVKIGNLFTVVPLKNELDFSDPSVKQRPICLQSQSDERRYKRANVTGFGITVATNETSFSDALMEASIKIAPVTDRKGEEFKGACGRLIEAMDQVPQVQQANDIFACLIPNRKRRPKGVCEGDVGAPVMARIPIVGKKKPQNLQLIGMVTEIGKYKERCGTIFQPALIIKGSFISTVIMQEDDIESDFKTCSAAPIPSMPFPLP